jgi:prepilin-type processing-associated H-X9-DG protein
MSPDRASQFSRRDLIAATVATGLICAVIVPSCDSVTRTPGHRNICQNNQHNISLALLQYAEANRHYLGYANTVASRTTGYLVPLLPYLERNDVYQAWNQPDGTTAHQQALVYMPLLVCPSNPPADSTGTPNAYVINAGQADPAEDISPGTLEANGIATDLTVAEPVLISPQYVAAHDGAQFTLLVSENIQAQSWTLTDPQKLFTGTTFLWWNDPPIDTRDYRINQGKDSAAKQRELVYCRPSGNHPGGVVASFCDGHVRFIAEDLDYDVYKQLMTPNGAGSGDTVNREVGDYDY